LFHPNVVRILKAGIIVTWKGIIIVASTTIKRKFLPGNWNLAKTYPASEQKNKFRKQRGIVTTTLFKKNLANGTTSNNWEKLSNLQLVGSIVGGQIYVSGKDLNAVNAIHTKGNITVSAAKSAMK
jgi:hypothetical protein